METGINLYKGRIKVSIPGDLEHVFHDLSTYFLPDYLLDGGKMAAESHISLKRGECRFAQNGMDFTIQGDYDDRQLALDGIMLCSHVGEYMMINDGCYSFHSSAVSDGEQVILLTGPSGSGKTTVALKLGMSGLSLYSNDRTILKGREAVGGNKKLLVRAGTMAYESTGARKTDCSPDSAWDRIMYVNPEDIGIQTDSGRRGVRKIILLRRSDHGFSRYRLDRNAMFLRLYEQLLNFVDSFPNVILGQREPLPLIRVDRDMRMGIMEYATNMIEWFDPEVFAGDIDSIIEEVKGEMQ